MQVVLVIALVFAVFVAVFAIQNSAAVTVKLLTFEFSTSLVMVVLGSAAAGGLAVGLVGIVRQIGTGLRLRAVTLKANKLEADLDTCEVELARLRKEVARIEAPAARGEEPRERPDESTDNGEAANR